MVTKIRTFAGLVAAVLTVATAAGQDSDGPKESRSGENPPAEGRALVPQSGLGKWREADYGGLGVVDVEDGVLSLGAGDPLTAVVWTGPVGTDAKDALPAMNYRLSWEARRVMGGDFFSTCTFPVGEECCSLVLGGWGGAVTGLSTLNEFDAVRNDTCDSRKFEDDRWYKFTITVRPDEIAATCDGEPLFPAIDPREYRVGVRVEMEPAKPLSFSSYVSSGEIRNVRMTPLPPRAVKPVKEWP